jgi:hypothetical protein
MSWVENQIHFQVLTNAPRGKSTRPASRPVSVEPRISLMDRVRETGLGSAPLRPIPEPSLGFAGCVEGVGDGLHRPQADSRHYPHEQLVEASTTPSYCRSISVRPIGYHHSSSPQAAT